MYKLIACFLTGAMLLAGSAFADQPAANPKVADTNMEILKQKLKADKKLLVASNMELSDAEGKQFWPIYESYQKDLEGVNKQLVKTLGDYAETFNKGTIPNDTAKRLLGEALSVEDQEIKLKHTYAEQLEKVLPANKVARYIQIETKVRSLLKYDLAQQIPLVY